MTPSKNSIDAAKEEGRSAYNAMERNSGGGYDNPDLVRAWVEGYEEAMLENF